MTDSWNGADVEYVAVTAKPNGIQVVAVASLPSATRVGTGRADGALQRLEHFAPSCPDSPRPGTLSPRRTYIAIHSDVPSHAWSLRFGRGLVDGVGRGAEDARAMTESSNPQLDQDVRPRKGVDVKHCWVVPSFRMVSGFERVEEQDT